MRRGNKVEGLLHMLKLAPQIIGNWLRWACNQAETSSRALSFIFSSKVTTQFQAYTWCLKDQLQVGRNWFARGFYRNSYSCLSVFCLVLLLVFWVGGLFFFFFKQTAKQSWEWVCFFSGRGWFQYFLNLKLTPATVPQECSASWLKFFHWFEPITWENNLKLSKLLTWNILIIQTMLFWFIGLQEFLRCVVVSGRVLFITFKFSDCHLGKENAFLQSRTLF